MGWQEERAPANGQNQVQRQVSRLMLDRAGWFIFTVHTVDLLGFLFFASGFRSNPALL
jgi:hypothetical protein